MKRIWFFGFVFSFLVVVGTFWIQESVFAACREVTCASSCGSQLEVTNACKDEILPGEPSSCSSQGKKACIPQSFVSGCPNFNSQCAVSCSGTDDATCANVVCPTGMKYCKTSSSSCTGGQCGSVGACPSGSTHKSECDGSAGNCGTGVWYCTSGGGGSGTTAVKCDPAKFKEYAGVCFPLNTGLSEMSVAKIVMNLMKWMLYLFGFLAIIAFVISGIQYLSAAGNMNMIETAKRNMTWSIVGVIVALAGLVIIIAIDALLRGTAWGG